MRLLVTAAGVLLLTSCGISSPFAAHAKASPTAKPTTPTVNMNTFSGKNGCQSELYPNGPPVVHEEGVHSGSAKQSDGSFAMLLVIPVTGEGTLNLGRPDVSGAQLVSFGIGSWRPNNSTLAACLVVIELSFQQDPKTSSYRVRFTISNDAATLSVSFAPKLPAPSS